jgi:deoxyribose-phosphate aldolase
MSDVLLFKEHIGPGVKIKAAGGIKTREGLEQFLSAGCDRIGTSSAVALLSGGEAGGY